MGRFLGGNSGISRTALNLIDHENDDDENDWRKEANITPVFAKKRTAMEVAGAQGYLREYYFQRASQRANHARRICGDKEIKFAEAFQRVSPTVLKGFESVTRFLFCAVALIYKCLFPGFDNGCQIRITNGQSIYQRHRSAKKPCLRDERQCQTDP
jgi:hypothetical protein